MSGNRKKDHELQKPSRCLGAEMPIGKFREESEVSNMQIARVQRGDKNQEKVFISIQNIQGSTITTGLPVNYAVGASNDGLSGQIANTAANYPGFAGVAVKDIAANDIGLVQIAGFVNSILLSNLGTSITVNAGDPLVPSPAGFFSSVPTYANSGFRWVFASNLPVAVSAVAYASGLIKMI